VFELEKIRKIKKLALIAVFSDDDLMDSLVLKGGNAIELILNNLSRFSLDLDFSIPHDFSEFSKHDLKLKFEKVLTETFFQEGYIVFDVTIFERPPMVSDDMKDFWGGFLIEFKVAETDVYNDYEHSLNELRKRAVDTTAKMHKKFRIEISKFEYCAEKQSIDLDGYTVFVYTPAMLFAEKLRAICQQMPEYGKIVKSESQSPRGRDFFDLHLLENHFGIDITKKENLELLKTVFKAKHVPLSLIDELQKYREYHRDDFKVVENSVPEGVPLRSYDYYFDFVLTICEKLKALGVK